MRGIKRDWERRSLAGGLFILKTGGCLKRMALSKRERKSIDVQKINEPSGLFVNAADMEYISIFSL